MDLWIQPCAPCADLHGQRATVEPHDRLNLTCTGPAKDAAAERRYTCARCGAAFVRILAGEPRKRIWILLNAGQH
jgi:hypothetical protein